MKTTTKMIVKSYAKTAAYAALSVGSIIAGSVCAVNEYSIAKKSAVRAVDFAKQKRVGAAVLNAAAVVEMGVFAVGSLLAGNYLMENCVDKMADLAVEREGLRAGMKASENSIDTEEEVNFDD